MQRCRLERLLYLESSSSSASASASSSVGRGRSGCWRRGSKARSSERGEAAHALLNTISKPGVNLDQPTLDPIVAVRGKNEVAAVVLDDAGFVGLHVGDVRLEDVDGGHGWMPSRKDGSTRSRLHLTGQVTS